VDPESLVEVVVITDPDGTVSSFKILHSRGSELWATAVQKALMKTDKLPLDSDGKIPPRIILVFRPSREMTK
jgi:colicin import membrane protein